MNTERTEFDAKLRAALREARRDAEPNNPPQADVETSSAKLSIEENQARDRAKKREVTAAVDQVGLLEQPRQKKMRRQDDYEYALGAAWEEELPTEPTVARIGKLMLSSTMDLIELLQKM